MQAAHERLLKQFVDIDKGKRLSVGPAYVNPKDKGIISPVEEMHSLNYVRKMQEFKQIDHENERLIAKLSEAPSAVLSQSDLQEKW